MTNTDLCSPRKTHVHTPVALRTPLRCGLYILVCSCLLFGAQQCRARGQQDVAAAARQERARKDQSKKTRHVYTDEDLKRDKILTPEDEARVAADRKQPAPGEQPTETLLDASADVGQLPLGDIARLYRNAKRAMQAPPFHLPIDEPVLAEPLFAAPSFTPPLAPAPEFAEIVDPAVKAPTFATPRPVFAPVRPHLTPAHPHVAAAPAMSQPALRRVDPFAKRLTPAAPVYVAPAPDPLSHRAIPAPPAPSATPVLPNAVPTAPRLNGVRPSFAPPSAAAPTLAKPSHRAISAPTTPSITPSAPKAAPTAPELNTRRPSFAPPTSSVVAPTPAAPVHRAIPAPSVPVPAPSAVKAAPIAPRFSVLERTFTPPTTANIVPIPTPTAPHGIIPAPPAPSVPPSKPNGAPAVPRFSMLRRTFTPPTASEIAPAPNAPVAPTVAPVVAPTHSVVVQPGDSLWSLAVQHLGRGSRWHELLAANPAVTDPNRIAAGTQLVVPEKAARLTSDVKIAVQRGDTLSKIAQAQYRRAANWRCIAAANPQIQDANRIFEGQELLLPANCQK